MKFIKKISTLLPINIFNYKNVSLLSFVFTSVIILSHYIVRQIWEGIFRLQPLLYWPIIIFWPRTPSTNNLIVTIIICLSFFLIIRYLSKIKLKLFYIIIFGIFLILGTNLIQGFNNGFVGPIAGAEKNGILFYSSQEGIQYYHDAIKIKDPLFFFSNFEYLQPKLLLHSRTHPPGAVLLIYLLLKLAGSPIFISITITILSASLSMFFLYQILRTELEDKLSKYCTFLFILIPSIQIYYCASIDALIASFLLGALYFFIHPKPIVSIIGSIFFLFLASFMTFAFLFALPIMAGFEIARKKQYFKTLSILVALALIYLIIYIFFHFNYLTSFKIATIIDNSRSFRVLSDPKYYLVGRLTGIYEIILFFGPFLGILAINGIWTIKQTNSDLLALTRLATFTLLAMFLTGAFRGGETARICLFIYPYLFFPAALFLENLKISSKNKNTLLFLVFMQSVLMQMFGFYAW